MKPIVKIVILSIVAVILVTIMVVVIALHNKGWEGKFNFGMHSTYFYGNSDEYSVGDAELTGEIKNIDMNWVAGSVQLEATDGDKIVISETASWEMEEKDKLRYAFEDGTLKIKYRKSGYFTWFKKNNAKHLIIKVPKQYLENMENIKMLLVSSELDLCDLTSKIIKIEAVSGSVVTHSLNGEEFSYESVSGSFTSDKISFKNAKVENVSGQTTINNCEIENTISISSVSGGIKLLEGEIDDLVAETVSGGINVKCKTDTAKCTTVSGKITTEFMNCPSKIDIESVSGGAYIKVAANDGFTANFSSVSGKLSIGDFTTTKNGEKYVYENGKNKFNFQSVSGNFYIGLMD